MNTPALVFFGVAAVGALVQAFALVVLGLEMRRTFLRVDTLGERVARDLRPAVSHLTDATARLAHASELSLLQARRLDGLVSDATSELGRATDLVKRVVIPQAIRAVTLATAVRTARSGLAFYRRWRSR